MVGDTVCKENENRYVSSIYQHIFRESVHNVRVLQLGPEPIYSYEVKMAIHFKVNWNQTLDNLLD